MNHIAVTLKACIFDLDGVIADTAKYHFEAWKKLAESVGTDFTIAQNEQLKGVSRIDSLNLILDWGGISKTDKEKSDLCLVKNEIYLDLIKDLSTEDTLPGIVEMLKELKSLKIRIGLGSASKNAVAILKRLDLFEFFETIIDGTKVEKGKPDPETFLKGSLELNIDPQNCIVFEDAAKGVQAAKQGGMTAVGIGDKQILRAADYVISGFEDLDIEDIIKELPLLKLDK